MESDTVSVFSFSSDSDNESEPNVRQPPPVEWEMCNNMERSDTPIPRKIDRNPTGLFNKAKRKRWERMRRKVDHPKYKPCTRISPHAKYRCPGRCNFHLSKEQCKLRATSYHMWKKLKQYKKISSIIHITPKKNVKYFIKGKGGISQPICNKQLKYIYQISKNTIQRLRARIKKLNGSGEMVTYCGGRKHFTHPKVLEKVAYMYGPLRTCAKKGSEGTHGGAHVYAGNILYTVCGPYTTHTHTQVEKDLHSYPRYHHHYKSEKRRKRKDPELNQSTVYLHFKLNYYKMWHAFLSKYDRNYGKKKRNGKKKRPLICDLPKKRERIFAI